MSVIETLVGLALLAPSLALVGAWCAFWSAAEWMEWDWQCV